MAGIYIHIPFCKKACHYCNFHFSTQLNYVEEMVNAIIKEIDIRSSYLSAQPLDSIYFGGGTPSILGEKQLGKLFERIYRSFSFRDSMEITLEANPDDLSREKLDMLSRTPINRLSIGIQSFDQEDLTWMNRSHDAIQAVASIQTAQELGFENLNIDLIFGGLTTTMEKWKKNLDIANDFDLPHISCYGLTIEERTVLHGWIKKKKMAKPDDEIAANQYIYLMEYAKVSGWEHYEISNFCKNGQRAKHNTSYWEGASYAGFGPSAHSFDGMTRQWNIANNQIYLRIIEQAKGLEDLEKNLFQTEILSDRDKYNEGILLGLRQSSGIAETTINPGYEEQLSTWIQNGLLIKKEGRIFLSDLGKLMADQLISALFLI
jgi:oxygen-independent coproporphyrinogen III oxidase